MLASACSPSEPEPEAGEAAPVFELRPVAFDDLEGWAADDVGLMLPAFLASCAVLERRSSDAPLGKRPEFGTVADWQGVCRAARGLGAVGAEAARRFFETNFQPFAITDDGDPEGLFTGYYEPLLHGARAPSGRFTVPIRRAPDDMVRIDLGAFDSGLAGRAITGRIAGNRVLPYFDRAEIENGALEGRGLELIWVDDAIDKFFLQIQGSGRVRLDDGTMVRVGYSAQNGRPYRAIGRDLIELGELEPAAVSLQSIRAWLRAHPDRAPSIMARNRSYVFFQEQTNLDPDEGPLGAQGVPLSAGRSLAADLDYLPLGTPLWLETTVPGAAEAAQAEPWRRLMVVQDTGGAITGVVRGDIYFGSGDAAEARAGHMKNPGRYVVLLPRALVPVG